MAEPAGAGPSGNSTDQQQQAGQLVELPKPKQIGRPPHEVWRWFRKIGTAHKSSNLTPAVCIYAPPRLEAQHTIRTSTVDNLIKHLADCPAAPADARARANQLLADRASEAAAPNKRRRQAKVEATAHALAGQQHPQGGLGQQVHGEMTPALAREVDAKLLRWMEVAGVAVSQTDTPEFVDLCRTLHPAYFPGRLSWGGDYVVR